MNPLVSVIIVNYNGRENVVACLEAFQKQEYRPLEMIVVDNGSTDDSILQVKRQFPKVKVIENGKNLGFGAAVNVGVKQSGGKYVMLYNDDIFVKDRTVSILVETMESDSFIGATQSKLLSFAHPHIVQSARSYLTWTGIATGRGGFVDSGDTLITPTFSAGAPMVRRDLFDRLSGFDNNYFLYFEETDFAWRVWLAGYTVLYVPASEVLHQGGATTKKLQTAFIVYNAFRNRLHSLMKNLGLPSLFIIVPFHILLISSGSILFLLVGKPTHAFSIWKAIWWNMKHMPQLVYERQRVQRQRKVRDVILFPIIMEKISFAYFFDLTKRYLKDVYLYEGR